MLQGYKANRTLDVVVDAVSHLEQCLINLLPFERPLHTQYVTALQIYSDTGIVQCTAARTAVHEPMRVREGYGNSLWQACSAVKTIITRQFDRPMSNGMAALSREDTTPQTLVEFCTWQNSVRGQQPPKCVELPAQETAKHHAKFG